MRNSELVKMDCLIAANAASSAIYSNRFSLKEYQRGSVLITAGLQTTGAGITGYLVAGDSTTAPSGYTAIPGSSFVLSVAGSTITSGNEIGIALKGTISTASTGITVIVDGYTFTAATVANSTALAFAINDATVCAASLSTLIAQHVTYVETTFSGSGTAADVRIKPKNGVGDRQITVKTTACATASSDKIGAYRISQSAIVDFNSDDIGAISTAYTHAAVFITTTESSALPFNAVVIRSGGRFGISQATTSYADCSTLTT